MPCRELRGRLRHALVTPRHALAPGASSSGDAPCRQRQRRAEEAPDAPDSGSSQVRSRPHGILPGSPYTNLLPARSGGASELPPLARPRLWRRRSERAAIAPSSRPRGPSSPAEAPPVAHSRQRSNDPEADSATRGLCSSPPRAAEPQRCPERVCFSFFPFFFLCFFPSLGVQRHPALALPSLLRSGVKNRSSISLWTSSNRGLA